MTIRKQRVLLNVPTSTSGTGDWYQVDYRFDVNSQRSVFGTMTAADTVFLEVTPQPIYNTDGTAASVSVVVTVTSFTGAATFSCVLDGPFAGLRVRKPGTGGPCMVQGVV